LSEVNKDLLTKKFPREAIRSRKGGGNKSLDYVEGHTVIQRLNDATGNCWDWRLDKVEHDGDLFLAYGTLTIPGLGSRQGIGVQKVAPNSGEDLIKGVSTDALKKAATLFGVALELYGPDYEAEEEQRQVATQTRPNKGDAEYDEWFQMFNEAKAIVNGLSQANKDRVSKLLDNQGARKLTDLGVSGMKFVTAELRREFGGAA
jgi:recombination DNA repair RAD52 pathway protein